MKYYILILALLFSACLEDRPSSHVAVVIDRSATTNGDINSVTGVITTTFSLKGIRDDSRLNILATGDRKTAMEPVLLGQFSYALNSRVMEGLHMDIELREKLLREIETAVETINDRTSDTPLYLAIRRALETLQSQGCQTQSSTSECYLWIVSDGLETQQLAIANGLKAPDKFNPSPDMIMENTGVNVVFCNLAVVDGDNIKDRDFNKVDAIEKVWRSLFSDPDNVVMMPFCPARKEI